MTSWAITRLTIQPSHWPYGMLAVTAASATLRDARDAAYAAVARIDYADGFHRTDIGWRELERTETADA